MHPSIVNGICEYSLESWTGFHELSQTVFSKAPAYVYRGQANYGWPLLSSLDRLTRKYPKRKNPTGDIPKFFKCLPFTDEEQLKAFKRAVRGRLGANTRPTNDDEWWALGQHHGLATPLLDWTRSPYIALFFAFQEELAHTENGTRGATRRGTLFQHPPCLHRIPREEGVGKNALTAAGEMIVIHHKRGIFGDARPSDTVATGPL